MEIKKGIAVSPGVVIANAVVLDSGEYRIPYRNVPAEQVEAELEKLRKAFEDSITELNSLRDATAEQLGRDIASIFDFHYGVLTQGRLREQIAQLIRNQNYSAAFAVREALRGYQRRFLKMPDQLLRERYKDVRDIERRLLRNLIGQEHEDLSNLPEPSILVAHDLTPSQSANLVKAKIIGVAMDAGGLTSHTAIVVRSMGIPAVMGLQNISAGVSTGDTIILDGTKGLVIVGPDPEMLAEYRAEERRLAAVSSGLIELRDKPAVTEDGVQISLLANIEFPYEVQTTLEKGAEGIGLYRTEFLYLRSEKEPTEEEHYDAYTLVMRNIGQRPVIIRTLDLGADKYTQSQARDPERNPFLGLRSIRYCLQNLQPFKVQLRAILRTSVEGDVRIMFPLISGLMELRQAKMALGDAMEDLEELGIPFRRDMPVGIMVETPAAAIQIRELLRETDFISIGTNDLIQYTLAVDRGNERVAPLYTASHPAVLRMLRDIIREANRANVPCSLCGEMAGEPMYTLFLLGIGLRSFSMAPNDIPEIKKIIRSTTIARAVRIARRALSFDTDRQVSNYLRDETRRIAPEAL
ncbi:MAG TPA: phosphoenolpyruvate--protein phosphotransferase [Phycisphaerae bacterium]|nr:phosphoenolpyruvate--protein phosphotransferase [Phycisphaerae bacterium]HQE28602.1 phosphoenolpyruvate--protein phosphotransferase [Phycisphaerae bacterium]